MEYVRMKPVFVMKVGKDLSVSFVEEKLGNSNFFWYGYFSKPLQISKTGKKVVENYKSKHINEFNTVAFLLD